MTPDYDPDTDEWAPAFRNLGYEWCRPCKDWHRPPECWIDSEGRPRLDLPDPNLTHPTDRGGETR